MSAAGPMRARILIEQATMTQSPTSGQEVPGWAAYATRWARRRPLTNREALSAQQIIAVSGVAFDVRYDSLTKTVTPHETFRVVEQGRPYDIKGVSQDERRTEVTFITESRAE